MVSLLFLTDLNATSAQTKENKTTSTVAKQQRAFLSNTTNAAIFHTNASTYWKVTKTPYSSTQARRMFSTTMPYVTGPVTTPLYAESDLVPTNSCLWQYSSYYKPPQTNGCNSLYKHLNTPARFIAISTVFIFKF